MKPKQIITLVLIAFVTVSVAYMIAKETKAQPSEEVITTDAVPIVNNNTSDTNDVQIIVYYFHGDVRCATCHKLESYAKETLDTYFADGLANGKIQWQAVNVEQPQNEHFIEDYKLITKSVVVSKVRQGEQVDWQNLDRIWQEVKDKQGYIEYVRGEIAKFIEKT
ncbi:MAG: nitrophenyl compound nitroreductase subunit ArsF family protein [Phycisphaerae bacterium]